MIWQAAENLKQPLRFAHSALSCFSLAVTNDLCLPPKSSVAAHHGGE
jgi:hypothetical protein